MNGSDPKATFPGTGLGGPAGGAGVGTQPGRLSPPPGTHEQPSHTGYANTAAPPAAHVAGGLYQGVVLGKYQIVRQLGSGGMGSVYEAVHTSIGKSVALKTMNPALASDPRAEARFMREAAAASRLGHPNVCDVTDFGSDQGVVYIVMELMRGEDLANLVAHAPAGLDASFVADVMLAVCAGVYAAHEKGVVHRDLKPQNIFLSRTPLGDVVPKVLDFGISKLLDEEVAGSLTNSGSVMGTTHYLSPEQVTGSPVDGRSDEFALGVILYECLTGQRPHNGDTIFTIMRAISEGRFQRPRALRPDLLPALESVVLRAMALRADDRYPTVHALGNGLLPFASPKGRVLWVDYFSRPPASGLSPALTGTAMQGSLANVTAQQQAYAAGAHMNPTMLSGGPRPFGGDTRSGVGPVSVLGTGELAEQGRRGRTRGLAFALAGAALATAGLVFLRPAFLYGPGATKVQPGEQLRQQEVNKPAAPVPAVPAPAPAVLPPATSAPAPATAKLTPPPAAPATPPADSEATPLSRKEQKAAAAKARAAARAEAKALQDAQDAKEAKAKEARAAKEAAAREAAKEARRAAAAAVTRPATPRPKPTRTPERPNGPDDDLIDGPRSIISPGRAPILD
jgi:serine/threonine-protein kinase